jgi:elongation factor Ts
LTEAAGDLKKAEEILRIRSGAKASKVASRVAAEGTIAAHVAPDGKSGALVEVNCETDFVAKDPGFTQFARAVAQVASERAVKDLDALINERLGAVNRSTARQALGKLGENLAIHRWFAFRRKAGRSIICTAQRSALVDSARRCVGKSAMHIAASSRGAHARQVARN